MAANRANGFIVHACEKTRDYLTELISHHKFLFAFVIAMLAVQLLAAVLIAPAFADTAPGLGSYAAPAQIGDKPIELAQANLPSIGSVDDYMHQSGDGPPSGLGPSSPGYSPRSVPPGYAPQASPAPELNKLSTNPNAQRDLLIGAAVVGAIALGTWAYQQHEQYEAQRRARRFYRRRPEYPY